MRSTDLAFVSFRQDAPGIEVSRLGHTSDRMRVPVKRERVEVRFNGRNSSLQSQSLVDDKKVEIRVSLLCHAAMSAMRRLDQTED